MACASSSFAFNFRHNHRLFPSTTLCNCKFSPTINLFVSKLSSTEQELEKKTPNFRTSRESRFGLRSSRPRNDKTAKQPEIQLVSENGGNDSGKFNGGKPTKGSRNSPVRPNDNVKRSVERKGDERRRGKGKWVKAGPVDSPELQLRVGLDMCSKRGDVVRAIEYFDSALKDGIRLGQYHYTVLLYLCSSAAVGVVRPAKSGSDSRSLDGLDSNDEAAQKLDVLDSEDGRFNEKEKINSFCNGLVKRSYRLLDGLSHPAADGGEVSPVAKYGVNNREEQTIRVDDELKEYARKRGFEIYEKMRSDNIAMNEAALTSVARMAMSMGDGDMAFEMVNQMKSVGISPRLRSYGPALSAFVNSGEIDKAFAVEEHMLKHGVYPEEPELQALLRVSIGLGKGDRVYYLLHKLRAGVRKVSNLTADMIIDWFNSTAASRVGKTKWSKKAMQDAIANGGGGWHGLGWLGRGKWSVLQTSVGADGLCQCCREKLTIIDLDPKETESFAESVASIAIEKEKHSNFQKFQKWLDYYGPFEAVVDGANVGLYSQKRFMPSKIKAIVNGVRQKLPSKKWPLIVLHNRRITGPKMDEALLDKWRNADAIYATPTGSNDDWYWLYAAIKFKCLLVTNDEMRDHTFQLLGNDFFPRWKERHQVHFSFSDAGLEFHLPPPYSVVVQESEKGHWHIPIATEHENESERPWLCIMRAKSRLDMQDSQPSSQVTETETKSHALKLKKRAASEADERYRKLRDILSGATVSDHRSVLTEIEFAEKLCGHSIDFQI